MSPSFVSVSAAWKAAGWTMLHLVWIGAAGGLGVVVLRRLLRRARPETRYGMAVACLLVLAAAPVLLFAGLYRPDRVTGPEPTQASRVRPDGGATDDRLLLPARELRRPGVELNTAASRAPISSWLEPVVVYLPGVWLSGSVVTLALLATGLVGVERLRRSSQPLETGVIARRCRDLTASLGIARRVGLAICDRLAAPILIGVIRPMILLPPAALSGWSIEQIEMALLHELAHIRRLDNLVTLLQRLAESLLFFHPVTWWLSAWVSLERELCCDRLVVEHTGRPEAYARMLTALAGIGRGAGAGAGNGPAPTDDKDPSNSGHGGPFDEGDADRMARIARHRGGRHDVNACDPRQASAVGPGRRGPPSPRATGGARGRAAGWSGGECRQGLRPGRNCEGPAQARRSCGGLGLDPPP